ncbi:hypothetical protein OWR29_40580 [Actinoplanes sp. Pm04-4]|uniref:Serine aminopeptidase S33 domain-containing protein n=1 Tax=Paractinoplanes pyxinae TaxID=2997416 RepID=A0ABT4BCT3_9ACTN|nr:hypothetical protein [Actinoplanes pyxinae]MCY1144329.1 hypothetical protein [Actinoplanes pyxinae]
MRTIIDLLRQGRFAEIEAQFAPRLRAAVSADAVESAWSLETARIGPIVAVGDPVREPGAEEGLTRLRIPVTGERGSLEVVMSVDNTGLLHGLRLAALSDVEWSAPRYARRWRFREQNLGSSTLTLPRWRRPRAGVVLLAGAGPFDRDGAAGPLKPMKDLAWGLASRGIAVLRFDKATTQAATMIDEYVEPALAAVGVLRRHTGQIFVVGHSGGGKAAPRVAAADPSIAGIAILAGDAAPLSQAAVRVARHLGADEALTQQAARVDDPDLSPSTPAADLLFGWPATYWLDLRTYDQIATAAALSCPVLILQGGRDHQVTVADDLTLWRDGLARRPDVTFRIHEADDHMFIPEDGPQNVDRAVVDDIARFVAEVTGRRRGRRS